MTTTFRKKLNHFERETIDSVGKLRIMEPQIEKQEAEIERLTFYKKNHQLLMLNFFLKINEWQQKAREEKSSFDGNETNDWAGPKGYGVGAAKQNEPLESDWGSEKANRTRFEEKAPGMGHIIL